MGRFLGKRHNLVIRGFCCSLGMTDQERGRNSNKEIKQGQRGQCYNTEVQSVKTRGLILIMYLLILTMETVELRTGSSPLWSCLIPITLCRGINTPTHR